MKNAIDGFSRLSKAQKTEWLLANHFPENETAATILKQYQNPDSAIQKIHDEFVENTITNFYLPYGIAPNFLINGTMYTIPMVTEESSVIAAACKSAKFWASRGGFKTKVLSNVKTGQIHLFYEGEGEKLRTFFHYFKPKLFRSVASMTKNMRKRGGGVIDIELRERTYELEDYYQIHCTFNTGDAMGANFINSCLEKFAETFENGMKRSKIFRHEKGALHIVASILSNYVPHCVVRAEVFCKVEALNEDPNGISSWEFANKFKRAVDIAKANTYRAVTHNKGIMNGVDAVVMATGNDFRAVEAGAHSYADGRKGYTSLSHASVQNEIFRFWVDLPLAVGTVGGLTRLHPLASLSLEMLGNPNAEELMQIIAAAGLAQNFAAIRSLVTTGIQKGHMKMHLLNILNQMNATEEEKEYITAYFRDKKVAYDTVFNKLTKFRKRKR